jgi:hypothetical protein
MPGVWTYAYRDADEAIVLGVWNSNETQYPGPIWVNSQLFERQEEWQVEEPRTGERRTLARPELAQFSTVLEPFSARVFRISPVTPV